MWYVSQAWVWTPLYILLIGYLLYLFHPKRLYHHSPLNNSPSGGHFPLTSWLPALTAILVVAAAAGLSDFVTSGLLKGWIARPRPTHTHGLAEQLHLVHGYTGGHYGFPSSHAANCWAVAISAICLIHSQFTSYLADSVSGFSSIVHCLLYNVLLLYALLNCYSRMYLGVHFPLDILCGAIIGTLIALLLYLLWKTIRARLQLPNK